MCYVPQLGKNLSFLLWLTLGFLKRHLLQTQLSNLRKFRCLRSHGPGHAEMCRMPYANNKSADQPAHPRRQISTFVVRCLDSMICALDISKVSRF